MTTDMIDLARRAVACPRWRWREGMLTQRGARVLVSEDDGRYVLAARRSWKQPALMEEGETPDLTDAATLGCLLALVTEAYYDPKRLWNGYVEVHRDQHAVFYLEQAVHDEDGALVWNCVCSGETKAEVLVRALEIAT